MLLERRQLTNGLPGRKQWLCHIQLSRFVKSKWTEVKLSGHSKSRSRLDWDELLTGLQTGVLILRREEERKNFKISIQL